MVHSTTHQPSPQLFFETVNAYQRTEALKTGIELDVFTSIGKGAATPAALALKTGASERGLRILCDYLTIIGFLTKQNESYGLTLDSSVFLDRRSPACVASAVGFLSTPALTAMFRDLPAAVRKGGTTMSEAGSMEPEHPMWVDFARSMAPLMTMSAEFIAGLVGAGAGRPCKVLDVAAGHGAFGIAIAKHNPIAQIYATDWAAVLEVAKENALAAGVADRHHTIPGSAFDVELGGDYDLVLLTNFLHHFDAPTNEKLLRRLHAALKPGGQVATLEFVPNDDRVTPPMSAAFSLMMLGSTAHGDAYTFRELEQMFHNAGFSRSTLHPLPPGDPSIVLSLK
ncbi:MAG: class I SAM-dependent methyltransferase [Bryobacteraceae bacterium]